MIAFLAQITNKALPAGLQNAAGGAAAGAGLGVYIGILWQTALLLGGLAVVAYMIMGGLNWITAAGDKGKIEQAKERITQGLIGLAVLFSVAAISTFFGTALGIDLLAPDFGRITPGGGGGGTSNSRGTTQTLCTPNQESGFDDQKNNFPECTSKKVLMKCSSDGSRWEKVKCL